MMTQSKFLEAKRAIDGMNKLENCWEAEILKGVEEEAVLLLRFMSFVTKKKCKKSFVYGVLWNPAMITD